MTKQYLIERIQLDYMENEVDAAVKWVPQEITSDLAYAERCVNESPIVGNDDCWALRAPVQSLRFREVESKYESYIDKLTELQKEIGYLPGVISPVAMLGLMGEIGEVAEHIVPSADLSNLELDESLLMNSTYIIGRSNTDDFVRTSKRLDNLKKQIRKNELIAGRYSFAVANEAEFDKELGDVYYYLNAIRIARRLSWEDLARMSYEKVMEKQKTMKPEQTGN